MLVNFSMIYHVEASVNKSFRILEMQRPHASNQAPSSSTGPWEVGICPRLMCLVLQSELDPLL